MSKHKKRISYSIKAAVAEVKRDQKNKRYFYGSDDKLPNNFIRAIADSGTATSCISRIRTFVQGSGFIDKTAAEFKVNPKQTAAQLLADISPSVAIFEAFALRVLYNVDGKPGSVYRTPLKSLRRNDNDTWRYNPRMGEWDYKKSDDVEIRNFNPNVSPAARAEIIRKEIAKYGQQLGEILCEFAIKEVDHGDIYPIPDAYSGLEDIEADAALQRLDKRNVKKGFKAQFVMSYPGEIDTDQTDEDGKTEWDYLQSDLKNFTKEDGDSVIILQSKVPGERPEVTPFPIADMLNGTAEARDRIARAVCRHLSTAPVLIGMEVPAILGNSQALINSLKVFLALVMQHQLMISRVFSQLFPTMDWSIGQANVFDYLPPEVMAKLTDDELRALGKYAPLPKMNDNSQKILDRLNTLDPLVSAEIIKRMSDNDILKLIGIDNGSTN